MMVGYLHGLLAIPSDGYSGQRIFVPIDEQKRSSRALMLRYIIRPHQSVPCSLSFSIALLVLDSTIEAFCTACARCIRTSRRRKKLNLDIKPVSQKELLRPRLRYGIDFYGVHNEEILGKVGLFYRETKLKSLPDRKMKRVCISEGLENGY